MYKTNNKSIFIKLIILLSIISLGITSFYFFKSQDKIEIKNFDKTRDREFILSAFNRDMYWLVENPEFSADFMMEHMSPNRKPEFFGKLNFKLLFDNGQPAGFTTYYKKKFYEGIVQFIYVDPKFRNKGYAKKLVLYAADQLFNDNASIVKLVTRVSNTPARKAYSKAGFKEAGIEDGFVNFEMLKK